MTSAEFNWLKSNKKQGTCKKWLLFVPQSCNYFLWIPLPFRYASTTIVTNNNIITKQQLPSKADANQRTAQSMAHIYIHICLYVYGHMCRLGLKYTHMCIHKCVFNNRRILACFDISLHTFISFHMASTSFARSESKRIIVWMKRWIKAKEKIYLNGIFRRDMNMHNFSFLPFGYFIRFRFLTDFRQQMVEIRALLSPKWCTNMLWNGSMSNIILREQREIFNSSALASYSICLYTSL